MTRYWIIIIVAGLVLLLALGAGAGLLWLNAHEYKPAGLEAVSVLRPPVLKPVKGQPIELYSWNIGYASLDASQDFFMDGGKGVRPSTSRNVEENIWAIQAFLSSSAADIVFFQEVDVNAKRSYGFNQASYFSETWKGSSAFAYNFKSRFVPVPFPRFIGKVESGLLTLNSYDSTAERISLPTSFPWPERIVQLKRCLLVSRQPVQDSTAKLVLVNVHMEAFDENGIGRSAQMKVLAEFLKEEYAKGNYCVAGGDFNQTFPHIAEQYPIQGTPSYTPTLVDTSFFDGEDWIFAADPATPTCRSLNKPYSGNREKIAHYIIDGFILSPNVKLLLIQTHDLDFKNSDHNPVKVTFSLK
jgi:endonuclease/exonuclease/phosphatase family metal-dependent hydrolase